jgi:hypothetical protein
MCSTSGSTVTILEIPESGEQQKSIVVMKERLEEQKSKLNQILDYIVDSYGFKLVVYTVFIGITIVPFAAIVIGSIHTVENDCPAESDLPLLLTLTGLLAVLVSTLDLIIIKRREKLRTHRSSHAADAEDEDDTDSLASDDEDEGKPKYSYYYKLIRIRRKTKFLVKASNLLKFLEISVFIYASVIVYRLYPSVQFNQSLSQSPGDEGKHYCDKLLFLFAFWSFTATFILLGAVILSLCFIGFCL